MKFASASIIIGLTSLKLHEEEILDCGVVEMNIFSNIGFPGLLLILVIALVVFGPSKLPEIGKAFGSSLKEFKSATKGIIENGSNEDKQTKK